MIFVSLDKQMKELEEEYKYKTLLSVSDLRNIFGWSRSTAYAKIDEGVFIPFGDLPADSRKIPKKVVFAYFKSLY